MENGDPGQIGQKRDRQLVFVSCVPEEKWINVHEHNNTSPSDEQINVNTTVGLRWSFQNLPSNSTEMENPHAFLQPQHFVRIGNSASTGFDWTSAPTSTWTNETAVTKEYTCKSRSTCVYKQLVGECGKVRVPVDKFSLVSFSLGILIPEKYADSKFTSCSDAGEILPSLKSGKLRIYPHGNSGGKSLEVLCDLKTEGGRWTIIQKRSSGPQQEFNKNWDEYSKGFGTLEGNFWLGLDNIHALTKNGDQELRIELESFQDGKMWQEYSNFSISDASDSYRLSIDGYSHLSQAGNSMTNEYGQPLNGFKFTTQDKDIYRSGTNCAVGRGGGWWYHKCANSNLNGPYRGNGVGIYWQYWKPGGYYAYNSQKTEMKIRKRRRW